MRQHPSPRRRPGPLAIEERTHGVSGPGLRRGDVIAAAVLLAFAQPVLADSQMPQAPLANTQLADPAKEAAAKDLMLSIRCLVCQGQSIADSDAEMAADMRSLIRTRVQAGEKPEAIRAWLVERYGDWVTYDTPLKPVTAPLWLSIVAFLGIGIWLARGRFRRRR